MISQEALKEFKAIYEKKLNQEISDEVATKEAILLLTFMDEIYRPIKKEWIKDENV